MMVPKNLDKLEIVIQCRQYRRQPPCTVGGVAAETITLSPQDVSAHLLNDWLPGVPAGQGADFMGWPNRLLSYNYGQLCLSDVVAQTERQWKG